MDRRRAWYSWNDVLVRHFCVVNNFFGKDCVNNLRVNDRIRINFEEVPIEDNDVGGFALFQCYRVHPPFSGPRFVNYVEWCLRSASEAAETGGGYDISDAGLPGLSSQTQPHLLGS